MPSCGVCVCVCVCVSCLCIVSKRIKTSSNFFHLRQPHHSSYSIPNGMAIFRWEPPPPTGASNAGGVGRNRDSEPICLLLMLQQARCCQHGCQRTMPPFRKLWQLYRWSYTAGIRPPSTTRDKVTISMVLQRDQARSRTIHNHDRSCVWQKGLTLCRRQQNRIELYALVNLKLK